MAEGQFKVTVTGQQELDALSARFAAFPDKLQKAQRYAISNTLARGRTAVAREIQPELNIAYGSILDRITTRNDGISGTIQIDRKPIPLIDFRGLKWSKSMRGVLVTVSPERGPELLPGTFVATMKSGHVGVFERYSIGGDRPGPEPRVDRLPIGERFGKTVVGYVADAPGIIDRLSGKLADILSQQFRSKLAFVFKDTPIPE